MFFFFASLECVTFMKNKQAIAVHLFVGRCDEAVAVSNWTMNPQFNVANSAAVTQTVHDVCCGCTVKSCESQGHLLFLLNLVNVSCVGIIWVCLSGKAWS